MRFKDEQERLIAEQAVLGYREVEVARKGAVFGHGMETVEEAVIQTGRRQQQQVLELALRSQAEAQKKGAVAHGAARSLATAARVPRR